MSQSTYAVSKKTPDALHRVNLHAGKYAEKARSHYPGNKPAARRNSVKKKALYQLKTTILSKLVRRGIAEATECHEIDGRDYYAISVAGEQSFHSPVDSWSGPSLDVDPDRDKWELTQFEKSSETDEAELTLKASLLHLNNEFGANANDYLEVEKVGGYFVGWKYL